MENKKMQCMHCGQNINVKEVVMEADGVTQCPECFQHDTFMGYVGDDVVDVDVEVVNLTPHPIVITDGPTFAPSETVARVESVQVDDGYINGISVSRQSFGEIVGLPSPQEGKIYIVSAIVLAAAKEQGRTDVVAPDTSNAVRNDQGHIVSVPGFVR